MPDPRDHPDDPRHIAGCIDCQTRANLTGLDLDLDRVWTGVMATVGAREPGRLERMAARLLGSPGLARALTATPSLAFSWVLASLAVLTIGAAATHGSEVGTPWVALLAPCLAGVGIAYSYGPGIDPAFELSQTMAIPDRMVLLVRVLAVFGLNALLGIGATLFTPVAAGVTWTWLVPMAMVSALALAAATVAGSDEVGVAAAFAGWALVVLGTKAETGDVTAAVGTNLAPAYLLATVVFGAVALAASNGQRSQGGSTRWQA